MSELSLLWTTNGTGDGSSAGYTQVHWSGIGRVLAACSGFEGVAPGYANELECSDNGANTVAVNTGGAVVDGKPYTNDASEDVNIPSAVGAGNTRIDRLVLRAGWAAQTVRITRIAGTDAATPSAPSITQTSGTTYDIQLCQVLVDTDGAVTVTDERTFAQGGANSIATGAVTVTKIGAAAVTSAKIASGAVVTTKLGPKIVVMTQRQGGSSSVWATPGSTAYTPTTVRTETGVRSYTISSGSAGVAIAFPTAFSQAPVVTATIEAVTDDDARLMFVLTSVASNAFQGYIRADGEASTWDGTAYLHWLAIGPE